MDVDTDAAQRVDELRDFRDAPQAAAPMEWGAEKRQWEAEKQQQREAEKRQREAEKRQRQAEKENETVKLSQMCAVDANKVAASQLGGHIFPPAVDPTTGSVCDPRTVFY